MDQSVIYLLVMEKKGISPWTKALYTCWSWKKTNERVDQRVIYLLVMEENE
jgi:hypothetical protein